MSLQLLRRIVVVFRWVEWPVVAYFALTQSLPIRLHCLCYIYICRTVGEKLPLLLTRIQLTFVPFWSVSRNISKRNLEETGPCTWYIKGYTTIMRLNLLSSFESDRGKSAKLWGWNLICQTNHYNLISR